MYSCLIRYPTANIHWIIGKARELQKNIYFCFIDYTKPLTVWLTANWKILQEMGIPVHLTCLLRNLYAGQEATVKTEHGITNWFQIGEELCQGCILSPCLFNLYAAYIMQKARLDESQAGIKIVRRHTNNLRCADETTLMAESEEELNTSEWLNNNHRHCNGCKMKKMVSALKIHHLVKETKTVLSNTVKRWEDTHNSQTVRARETEVPRAHRNTAQPKPRSACNCSVLCSLLYWLISLRALLQRKGPCLLRLGHLTSV